MPVHGSWIPRITLHPGEVEKYHHVGIPNLGVEARRAEVPAPPLARSCEDLAPFERKVYSPNGEDGVTLRLLELVHIRTGYFLEIGTGDGAECHTRILRERDGFTGLMLDGCHGDAGIGRHTKSATCENIEEICDQLAVPRDISLLSIHLHGNDYWMWETLCGPRFHLPQAPSHLAARAFDAHWQPASRRLAAGP